MTYWLWILIPIAFIVWFVWALVAYLRTPREDVETRNTRRILFIIPAGVLVIFVLAIITLTILLSIAITHM